MCGRFAQYSPIPKIARYFGVPEPDIFVEAQPRYNLAPGAHVLAVRAGQDRKRELVRLKWGLVPHWSKEPKTTYSTANARAETVDSKPVFRSAFQHRRCLIPADGWYEWALVPGEKYKQPWYYQNRDGVLLAFAGLWERWEQEDAALESCTIIVGAANELARPVHDRMPVILGEDAWNSWLNPTTPTGSAKKLLEPCPADWLRVHPVSRAVSSARNEGPDLIEPLRISDHRSPITDH